MQNGEWVLSSEDEWHLALANASSLIVSTEPWKPPDSKILVTSLTIDVPTSKQWLPSGDICRSLPPMYSLIRESACSSVSATSQLFASKPFASHYPSKSSLIFGAEILFLISCWRGIFVFHLLVSMSHERHPRGASHFISKLPGTFPFCQNSFSPGNLFKSDSHERPFCSSLVLTFAGFLPSLGFFSWWKVLPGSGRFLGSRVWLTSSDS